MKARWFLILAVCEIFPIFVRAQTIWFKYAGNPVMNVGAAGSWESKWVMPDRVIKQGSVYKMWYTALNSSSIHRIGYATSPNGITWTKYAGNPILPLGPSSWDAVHAGHGYVRYFNSTYHMWYFGGGSKYNIGYANSPDGIVWTKYAGNPVVNFGTTGQWDDGGIALASVLGPDSIGGFKMWFHGVSSSGVQIGLATATDSVTWTKYAGNPILPHGTAGSWDDAFTGYPRVLKVDQSYSMFYAGTRSPNSFQIGQATSPDGITWTKFPDNPVLTTGSQGSSDDYAVYEGEVIDDGNLYRMWYRAHDGATVRIAHAVSPKGFSVSVSTADGIINSVDDTIVVTVQVTDPANLKFSALFKATSQFPGIPVDTLELFDDGAHGDTLAGDGIFSNRWMPDSAVYDIDLTLTLYDTLNFGPKNVIRGIVTDVETIASQRIEDFHLDQNYPNPFNPSTKIGFRLQHAGFTSLKIFDLLGREVATLVNEELRPGSYEVTWEAVGMPSGVYFCTLKAGEFTETKRLVLVR